MPFATGAGNHRIHYRTVGDPSNPPLVLIQGLLCSGRFWFHLPELLAEDARDPWHVIVPDNRGVGQSDLPQRLWTMGTMADDVVAVLDQLGIRKATIVGISMGGMISQQIALRHPDRVSGLMLMATWPGLPYARLPTPRMLGTLVGSALAKPNSIAPLARLLLPAHAQPNARELLSGWIGLMREAPPPRETFVRQFAAVSTHSTGHRLERIQVPVRVVTGSEDALVPPRNSEILARRIRGSTLEVLPRVGHAIPLMDREVVHRNVRYLRPS